MKTFTVVNGVTFTRAQLEQALVDLNTPAVVRYDDLKVGEKFTYYGSFFTKIAARGSQEVRVGSSTFTRPILASDGYLDWFFNNVIVERVK